MPRLPDDWLQRLPDLNSFRLGGCDASGWPVVCRALTVEPLADGRVMVLASQTFGARVLAAGAASGRVSVVLASPRSTRTLHLKGHDARVEDPPADWPARIERRLAGFIADLATYDGFAGAPFIATWRAAADRGLRAVLFSPSGAWDQTPGPGAGQPIALVDG